MRYLGAYHWLRETTPMVKQLQMQQLEENDELPINFFVVEIRNIVEDNPLIKELQLIKEKIVKN